METKKPFVSVSVDGSGKKELQYFEKKELFHLAFPDPIIDYLFSKFSKRFHRYANKMEYSVKYEFSESQRKIFKKVSVLDSYGNKVAQSFTCGDDIKAAVAEAMSKVIVKSLDRPIKPFRKADVQACAKDSSITAE